MRPKKDKRHTRAAPVLTDARPSVGPSIWISGAILVALFAVCYWPAVHGPFLFDDLHVNYALPNAASLTLQDWLRQTRPLLMFTFWLNYHLSGAETFGYHVVNLLLHFCNAVFALLAVRKVLRWCGVDESRNLILSLFAGGVFLLHPMQTESVSYIVSRSETLSVFFVLAALVIYLYRPAAVVSIPRTLAVFALFAAAAMSKEDAVIVPALFILTDYYWNFEFSPSVIQRNWKFYVPIAAGATVALAGVLRVLHGNASAGLFQTQGLTGYAYFFTECRVVWHYLGLFVLPIGQNIDPDIDFSGNILARGAMFGLAGLLAVSIVAWIYRRRLPIASYGWFAFLILLAPTSSFLPLLDPMAEHRLYLPFLGLLLIAVEFLRRWKASQNVFICSLAAVLALESVMTYQRNRLWGNAVEMWEDAVSKSPRKMRPRFQLAFSYMQAGRCSEAAGQFQQAAALPLPEYDRLIAWDHELVRDWGLAYFCAGNPEQAIAKLQQAVAKRPEAQLYSLIGMEYGKIGKYPEALEALATAQRLDGGSAVTYYNRGNIYAMEGEQEQAIEDYQRALQLDPHNVPAREALFRMGIR